MNTDNTLVIQSHCHPLPHAWLEPCLNSVKQWSSNHTFDYQFINDELFDFIPARLFQKISHQKVIATDLARLRLLQASLKDYQTVVWCDADFLIFKPEAFKLSNDAYALGREVWIQKDNHQLKPYIKVHNAFMMYRKGNTFLDFYADCAENLIEKNTGNMPPQFIGPKLLTALHNIIQCPVLETAGMLSPLVVKDIAHQSGAALDLFIAQSKHPIYAANLCSSLYESGETNKKEIEICIELLLNNQIYFNRDDSL